MPQFVAHTVAQRAVEHTTGERILRIRPRDRIGRVGILEPAIRVFDAYSVVQVGHRVAPARRVHDAGKRHISLAYTAAPSRPASWFRITFTGIRESNSSIGGLLRKASMKSPRCTRGRIFGAMPPPTYTPAVATPRSARLPVSEP